MDESKSPLSTATNPNRPAGKDIRAVILAIYHDPVRFKPLMETSSPVPAGLTALLQEISRPTAKSDEFSAKERAELPPAAMNYLEKVLFADKKNFYRILGLPLDATGQDIQASYTALRLFVSRFRKPGTSQQMVDLISAAYVTLSDPERRRNYDRDLLTRPKPNKTK